jgi:hypothetical protein
MRPAARFVTSFAFCLFALTAGCRKLTTSYKPVGDPQCTKITLGNDVIASTTGGGGISGRIETTTYYADGRVITTDASQPATMPIAYAKVSVARMQKLDTALAKVLVGAKQGCWSSPPHADGTFARVAYQRNGTTYQISADDMSNPSGLEKAVSLLREVDKEIIDKDEPIVD